MQIKNINVYNIYPAILGIRNSYKNKEKVIVFNYNLNCIIIIFGRIIIVQLVKKMRN